MNTDTWNADFSAYAKMKILIVDDEPANVALLEDFLKPWEILRRRNNVPSRRLYRLYVECHKFGFVSPRIPEGVVFGFK